MPGSLVVDEIRFHCDQNVPNRLVDMLRARGVSVSTTREARLTDRPDVEQLRYAARHRCVLITNDVKWDFVALAESMPHAGVLFCNGGGRFPRDVLRRCLELAGVVYGVPRREGDGVNGWGGRGRPAVTTAGCSAV